MRACCGAAVARFDPAAAHRADGCATRDHAFIEQEEEERRTFLTRATNSGRRRNPRESASASASRLDFGDRAAVRRVIVEERGGANAVFREGAQFRGGGA